MKIKSVYSHDFEKLGKVLTGYDTKDLLKKLDEVSPKPDSGTVYKPGDDALEALPVAKDFSLNAYGGMPIEVGYCNGNNTKLNCLEWHRGSEINISADGDAILLLAPLQSVKDGKLSTDNVKAFRIPKGVPVEIYETTLHFAPCNDVVNGKVSKDGFRVVVVLPKDTNLEKPEIKPKNLEDQMLFAKNKWLIAHPDAPLAQKGAYVGLTGKNIDISRD